MQIYTTEAHKDGVVANMHITENLESWGDALKHPFTIIMVTVLMLTPYSLAANTQ